MAKILLVEDNLILQRTFQIVIENVGGHTLLQAYNVREARRHFRDHGDDIAIMIIDGYMHPDDLEKNTLAFIADIRAYGYTGHMIAASNDKDMRERQREAGCSHAVDDNKGEASKMALMLLKEMKPKAV